MNATVEALGVALVQFLLDGTLVALALAAFLAAAPRDASRLRYGAACVGLVALLAAPALRFGSALGDARVPAGAVSTLRALAAAQGATTVPPGSIAAAPAPEPSSRFGLLADAARRARRWLPLVVIAWAAGVALASARLLAGLAITARLRRSLRRLGEAETRRFEALARRLHVPRAPAIGSSTLVDVPTVVGWLRPVLLVPAAALAGLAPAQLEALLAHELAHVRRHDALVNFLQSAVETLLFYHPAVWWVSRTIRVERENCCDDVAVAAVGDAVSYARALVALEELRPSPALALAASGGSLTDRVLRLAGARTRRSSAAALAVVASLAAATFAAQGAFDTTPHGFGGAPLEPAIAAGDSAPEDHVTVRASAAPAAIATAAPRSATAAPRIAVAPSARPAASAMPVVAAADADDSDETSGSGPNGLPSVEELIALRQHGITTEFLDELHAMGYRVSPREMIRLRDAGVTPEYVKTLGALGYRGIEASELVRLRQHGVTTEWVKDLKDLGYDRVPVDDLIRLRDAGVTPELVRRLGRRSS